MTHELTGNIRRSNDPALVGTIIRGFSRTDVRRKTLLGEPTTDHEGRYSISYEPHHGETLAVTDEHDVLQLCVACPVPNRFQLRQSTLMINHRHNYEETPIFRMLTNGQYQPVTQQKLAQPDTHVMFPEAEAQPWRLALRGKLGGHVVLRGLRFFGKDREWYRPAVVE